VGFGCTVGDPWEVGCVAGIGMGPVPCCVPIVTGSESRISGEDWDLKIELLNERSSTAD
jgi:hypothetical protein